MSLKTFSIIAASLAFVACGVDTTGLSADSSRTPKGNPNALVTVTEFGDLQCPACKSAHTLVTQPLLEKYGDRISFVFKHFPLQNIHVYALEAAQASECAADQGKFWEFVDMTYLKQEELSSSSLTMWAQNLGLNMDLFNRCLKSGIKEATVLADYAEGEKLQVNSTPTYMVNGQKTTNNVEAIGAAIEAELERGSNVPL